jgi:hypothetical protein
VQGELIGSGHHFGGDNAVIADRILAFAGIMSHHNCCRVGKNRMR